MKSLTDLNTSSSATIEYTDNRAADVVWVKVNSLALEETSTQKTVTVKHSYDIFEIRQPQSTNITYEINVPTPLVPSWPNLPSELTLVQVGTVYKILGITTLDHWNAIKNGTITAPDDYQGNFTYEVDLKYTDTVGEQTLHWEVNEYLPVSLLASEFGVAATAGIAYPLASDMTVVSSAQLLIEDAQMFVYSELSATSTVDYNSFNKQFNALVDINSDITVTPEPLQPVLSIQNPNYFADNDLIGDGFGSSIAVENKTFPIDTPEEEQINYILAGARLEEVNENERAGVAYAFNKDTGNLIYTFVNPSPSGVNFDYFGRSVCITTDYFAVSAPYDENGKIYVYSKADGTLYTTISGEASIPEFGHEIKTIDYDNNKICATSDSKIYAEIDLTNGTIVRSITQTINAISSSSTDTFASNQNNWLIAGEPSNETAYVSEGRFIRHTLSNVKNFTIGGFGSSVAISENYFAIGGYRMQEGSTVIGDGQVFVYDKTTGNLLHTINSPQFGGRPSENPLLGLYEFGKEIEMSDNYLCISSRQVLKDNTIGRIFVYDTSTGNLISDNKVYPPDNLSEFSNTIADTIAFDNSSTLITSGTTNEQSVNSDLTQFLYRYNLN